jgi:hypothetical protein
MGWFAPGKGFLVRESEAAEIFLLAPLGAPEGGRRKNRLEMAELRPLRKQFGVACEVREPDTVTAERFGVGW